MRNIYLLDNIFSDCTPSSYSFSRIKYFFMINKYNIVNTLEEADYFIINTCGAIKEVEDKIYEYMLSLQDILKNKKVIFYGCLSSIAYDRFKHLGTIDYFIKTKEYKKFDYIFNPLKSIEDITSREINKNKILYAGTIFNNKKKYYLEISRGCVHKCSYCAIKKSIGYVSSRDFKDIIEEAKYAVNNGYNEIVLVSDDLLSYGYDNHDYKFVDLLAELYGIPGNFNIDLNYVEPGLFIKYYDVIKKYLGKISSITIPIQSFNDRILKLMNRNYSVNSLIDVILDIKRNNNNIKLLNHIIYCYPTETYDEFRNNITNCNKYDSNLFTIYSFRNGTKKIPGALSSKEIIKRYSIIKKLNKLDHNLFDITNEYVKV